MSTTALPAVASSAQTTTLDKAMADASIQSSPASSEPKELAASGSELEDGEIRDGDNDAEDEEDNGRVKTVFDDARKFNVKVRRAFGKHIHGVTKDMLLWMKG
jgi:translation initiation factor 4E